MTITTEREGESNNTYQEWDSYILFDSSLGSRMKFKIYGDTSSSEYYSGPIVYYPVTVNANTRIWYEYYYFSVIMEIVRNIVVHQLVHSIY